MSLHNPHRRFSSLLAEQPGVRSVLAKRAPAEAASAQDVYGTSRNKASGRKEAQQRNRVVGCQAQIP